VAQASYGGALADNVTIISDTEVIAEWIFGLPPIGMPLAPFLWFNYTNSTSESSIFFTDFDRSDGTLNITVNPGNPVGPTDFKCSFAGGCGLEVQAPGLSSILKNDTVNNYISICDEKCVFEKDRSDS